MPGRSYNAGSGYRYGFNGKENDKDISEGGQDYGMRISDNRLGKFLSTDPITAKYPELTPYQFASNRPIDGIDEDGLEYSPAGRNGTNQLAVDGTAVVGNYSLNLESTATLQVKFTKLKIEAANTNHFAFQEMDGHGNIYNGATPTAVQRKIKQAQYAHHLAIGDYMTQSGFSATVGYAIDGERGMYFGSALGNTAAAFTGLVEPGGSSVMSKPRTNTKANKPVTTNSYPLKPPIKNVTSGKAANIRGKSYEAFLSKLLGSKGSFLGKGNAESREIDGAYFFLNKKIYYEAKSANYFTAKNFNFDAFKSDIGRGLKVAKDNQAIYEVISENPIPNYVKDFLNKKGVYFQENVKQKY